MSSPESENRTQAHFQLKNIMDLHGSLLTKAGFFAFFPTPEDIASFEKKKNKGPIADASYRAKPGCLFERSYGYESEDGFLAIVTIRGNIARGHVTVIKEFGVTNQRVTRLLADLANIKIPHSWLLFGMMEQIAPYEYSLFEIKLLAEDEFIARMMKAFEEAILPNEIFPRIRSKCNMKFAISHFAAREDWDVAKLIALHIDSGAYDTANNLAKKWLKLGNPRRVHPIGKAVREKHETKFGEASYFFGFRQFEREFLSNVIAFTDAALDKAE